MSTKNFKNVKSILFDVYFKGNGCINWDCSEQGSFLRNTNLISRSDDGGFIKNGKTLKNIMFSKKVFKTNEDGKVLYKTKVSSECLRHGIFIDAMPFQNPLIMNIPRVLYSAIGTKEAIARGYMMATEVLTIKKKSALTITDAVDTGEWKDSISLDIHTRSGAKDSSEEKDTEDKKDTSLYKKENVGEATYKASGAIDLTELQFISNSPLYDRMAVNLDGGLDEKVYMDALRANMVNFEPERKYYYINTAYTQDEWAEDGILLNRESVDAIVKMILKNILKFNVTKRDAFLHADKMVITVNHEEGSETFEITPEMLEDMYFGYYQKYVEASKEKIEANKAESEKFLAKMAELKKNKGKKSSKKGKETAEEEA